MKNLAPWLFLAAVAVGGFFLYRRYGASLSAPAQAQPVKPMSMKKSMDGASLKPITPKASAPPKPMTISSSAANNMGKKDMSTSTPTVTLAAARANALGGLRAIG